MSEQSKQEMANGHRAPREGSALGRLMLKFCLLELGLSHVVLDQVKSSQAAAHRWRERKEAEQSTKLSVDRAPQERTRSAPVRDRFNSKLPHQEQQFSQFREIPKSPEVEELTKLNEITAIHRRFYSIVYSILCTKALFKMLIASDLFSDDAKLIDCFLVGRFRFVGRMYMINEEIMCFVALFSLGYRLVCASSQSKAFRLELIEFLLTGREAIREAPGEPARPLTADHGRSEAKYRANLRADCLRKNEEFNPNRHLRCIFAEPNSQAPSSVPLTSGQAHVCSSALGDAEVPQQRDLIIRRPCRNRKFWLKMNTVSKWALFYLSWNYFSITFSSFLAAIGSIATDFGFELSYPACTKSIRHKEQERWLNETQTGPSGSYFYEHIYRVLPPNRTLASELRLQELPMVVPMQWAGQYVQQVTLYNAVRILSDFLENAVLYVDCVSLLICLNFVVMMNCSDIIENHNRISERLELLIKRFEALQPALSELKNSADAEENAENGLLANLTPDKRHTQDNRFDFRSYIRGGGGGHLLSHRVREGHNNALPGGSLIKRLDPHLVDEITHVQAILHDHFSLIRGCNSYNSFLLANVTINWMFYTILFCYWLHSVKSRGIEIEFILVEISGTMLIVAFLAIGAVVHSKSLLLYRQISHLMAMDRTSSTTKLRWLSLVNYYYPKPLYCFTFFSTATVSWLFCLKLVSWALSAFVVMASFLYSPAFR